MAKMFPPVYRDPQRKKVNNELYNAEKCVFDLFKKLPNDYYVFHSYKFMKTSFGKFKSWENDFMIYHRNKGIIVFEVKGGEVTYANNQWHRLDRLKGTQEDIDPVSQVKNYQLQLIDLFKNGLNKNYINMDILPAIWVPNCTFQNKDEHLPFDSDLIFDRSDLYVEDIQELVDRIYDKGTREMKESHLAVEKVLFPVLNVVSNYADGIYARDYEMFMLTQNQSLVLEFTEFQNFTAISGGAGTGKTVVAEEKVRRLSNQYPEESVLFLCFNRALKESLEDKFKGFDNVKATNYDNLVWEYCSPEVQKRFSGNYKALREHFELLMVDGIEFPYKHIVIDEAQDFKDDWLEVLAMTDPEHFYLFYDRNQDIFNNKAVDANWSMDMDCKLTLNVNCRNTKEIAHFVNQHIQKSLLRNRGSVLSEVRGSKKPQIIFYEDISRVRGYIREKIEYWVKEGVIPDEKAKIISLRSGRDSDNIPPSIAEEIALKPSKFTHTIAHKNHSIPITSAGKIKGLEVDFVFLIDVNLKRYQDPLFLRRLYVAASRAKHELYMFVPQPTKGDVNGALRALGVENQGGNSKRQLCNKFAKVLESEIEF